MAITKARMGEIALMIFKQRLREDGIRLKPNFRREVGNEAQKTGIPAAELAEFAEIVIRELVEEAFAKDS
jgi:hypothetical protein